MLKERFPTEEDLVIYLKEVFKFSEDDSVMDRCLEMLSKEWDIRFWRELRSLFEADDKRGAEELVRDYVDRGEMDWRDLVL
ncbi:MAG: hypothetical protein COV70_02820 [Parcubacteria group bacterium CG11_big_fil_rev_8_21_14_0_20_39_22]|nr:MAG: hypothetical protein COV70_02820 [Parcubacteria group bacterium CG11_big_fil_rev_8_21_14_0_20_39_22]